MLLDQIVDRGARVHEFEPQADLNRKGVVIRSNEGGGGGRRGRRRARLMVWIMRQRGRGRERGEGLEKESVGSSPLLPHILSLSAGLIWLGLILLGLEMGEAVGEELGRVGGPETNQLELFRPHDLQLWIEGVS